MSTDGTQPPTITPQRPVPAGARNAGSVAERTGTTSTVGSTGAAMPVPAPSPGSVGAPSAGSAGPVGAGSPTAASGARTVRSSTDRPGADRSPAARGEAPRTSEASASAGPRRVRLAVARIDPWSVMKLSFLLSVAAGIMMVVATAVVWYTLDGLQVFTKVNDLIATLASDPTFFNILDVAGFSRVISLATMIAGLDVILLTALATIGAFLYNIVAALVGGIHLTLTDD